MCIQRNESAVAGTSQSNLSFLGDQIKRKYGVEVHTFEVDLTQPTAVTLLNTLKNRFHINFLINNAGVGLTSGLIDTPFEKIDKIIQVNIRALTLVSQIILPELIQHPKSYVLNVSSFAAFSHMAYKTVYPASKAFINSFSMSLQEEFKHKNLSVSVINPGPIATNFDTSRRIIKQGFRARIAVIPVQEIAKIAIDGTLEEKKIIIPGFFNVLNYWLLRFLPLSWCASITSKITLRELKGQQFILDTN